MTSRGKADEMTNWLYDAAVDEEATIILRVEPEQVPHLKIGKEWMVVDGRKSVTAVIGRGSDVVWNEEQGAWIARLNMKVTKVEVHRDLRSV